MGAIKKRGQSEITPIDTQQVWNISKVKWRRKLRLTYDSCSKQSFVTGLSMMLIFVCRRTDRANPLLSWKASKTLPSGQEPRGAVGSMMITISPGLRLPLFWFHFCRSCSKGRYSRIHLFQKRSEIYWTCLHLRLTYRSCCSNSPGGKACFPFISRIWLGVRGSRLFGSFVYGRSCRIASASYMIVWNPSLSSLCCRSTSQDCPHHANHTLPYTAIMWPC